MKSFLSGFFKENAPESMTRLTLFLACVNVIFMTSFVTIMFYITEGKLDFSSQVALLSGLLLGAFVTGKVMSKSKENFPNKEEKWP